MALAFSTDNCTIGRAMAVLGERWSFVVVAAPRDMVIRPGPGVTPFDG